MLIKTDLVQQSCKRLNFDLAKLIDQLQKVVSRERWMTAEKKERRYRTLLSDTGSPELARTQLERIINGNDLVSINYLERGWHAFLKACAEHKKLRTDIDPKPSFFLIETSNQVSCACGTLVLRTRATHQTTQC